MWSSKSRITPARAGNRNSSCWICWDKGDHPRACGEQLPRSSQWLAMKGSPPRVRGTGIDERKNKRRVGITPARAGNSSI